MSRMFSGNPGSIKEVIMKRNERIVCLSLVLLSSIFMLVVASTKSPKTETTTKNSGCSAVVIAGTKSPEAEAIIEGDGGSVSVIGVAESSKTNVPNTGVKRSATVVADVKSVKDKVAFNWEPVMEAIIQVESEGNPNAVSGNSCGAMQITPILVRECNDILQRRNSSERFTLRDRFSVSKSKEMFLLIQSHFNPDNNVDKAIRSWNGGMRYSKRRTQRYYEKVMRKMQ